MNELNDFRGRNGAQPMRECRQFGQHTQARTNHILSAATRCFVEGFDQRLARLSDFPADYLAEYKGKGWCEHDKLEENNAALKQKASELYYLTMNFKPDAFVKFVSELKQVKNTFQKVFLKEDVTSVRPYDKENFKHRTNEVAASLELLISSMQNFILECSL